MSDNTGLYIVDWKNGFMGLFKKSTLDQYANMYIKGMKASELLDEFRHLANLGGRCGHLSLEFLEGGHAELNRLRAECGFETKPML